MYTDLFMISKPKLVHETTNAVIACPNCKGRGFTSKEEMTDYHRNDYDMFHYKCACCDGEGRVVETKKTYRFEPLYHRGNAYATTPLSKFEGDANSTVTTEIPLEVIEDAITTSTHTPRIQEKKSMRY